jgi:quercetin dioxygenase-like cupin family protein
MHKFSLDAISREQQQKAAAAASGRAAETVFGGHERALRQTVIAMGEGRTLSEHENPGEATVLVLQGRIRLTAGSVSWEGRQGDLLVVPQSRHAVQAITAAVVLLTVVKLQPTPN